MYDLMKRCIQSLMKFCTRCAEGMEENSMYIVVHSTGVMFTNGGGVRICLGSMTLL